MKQSDTGLLAIKWMDKKQVNIISTCSQPIVEEVSRRSKAVGQGRQNVTIPSAVLDYNKNMNDVDLADQYRAYYSVGRSGSKWWRYCFWFLVQTSIVNAYLLYRRANLPRARLRVNISSSACSFFVICSNILQGSKQLTSSKALQ